MIGRPHAPVGQDPGDARRYAQWKEFQREKEAFENATGKAPKPKRVTKSPRTHNIKNPEPPTKPKTTLRQETNYSCVARIEERCQDSSNPVPDLEPFSEVSGSAQKKGWKTAWLAKAEKINMLIQACDLYTKPALDEIIQNASYRASQVRLPADVRNLQEFMSQFVREAQFNAARMLGGVAGHQLAKLQCPDSGPRMPVDLRVPKTGYDLGKRRKTEFRFEEIQTDSLIKTWLVALTSASLVLFLNPETSCSPDPFKLLGKNPPCPSGTLHLPVDEEEMHDLAFAFTGAVLTIGLLYLVPVLTRVSNPSIARSTKLLLQKPQLSFGLTVTPINQEAPAPSSGTTGKKVIFSPSSSFPPPRFSSQTEVSSPSLETNEDNSFRLGNGEILFVDQMRFGPEGKN